MRFKKPSKAIMLLTSALTLCVVFGAAFIGIYSIAATDGSNSADDDPNPVNMETLWPSQPDNSPLMEILNINGTTYYLVHNEDQLRAIGTSEYGMGQNYMQQADILLSADEWVPIGTWNNPFTGTFNGNGFEITGLTMTDPDAEIIGLFGVAENAHIYNVTMRDYDILNAGANVQGKSVGAILAVGKGCRSYDNFAYPKESEEVIHNRAGGEPLSEIERYYADGSLPLFEIAFSRLDESAQKTWLEKLYADDDISFFYAALCGLGVNSSLPADFAEKAYADEEISFFSILADCLEEAELTFWLNQALEDGKWNFQSVLFDKLGQNDEFDELKSKQEKEWAEAQKAEYQAVGITMNGKNYYYQEELVNIFLDIRANQSFYTLNMNPAGTVNVKIIRDTNDKITDAVYMTDEEVTRLLNGMDDDSDWPDDMDARNDFDDWQNKQEDINNVDDWRKASGGRVWHPQVFPVNVERMEDGEIVRLGEYTLSEGDRMWYYVFAEAGNGLQVGFARPDDELLNTAYYSVQTLRQENETQKCECIASFTFKPPVEPGTYVLFLRATDGALENVKGSISIGYKADVS